MSNNGKRQRGNNESRKSTEVGHVANHGRRGNEEWHTLIKHLDVALTTRDELKHAVVQAVIEHQVLKDKKWLEDMVGTNGGEESSDEFDDQNCATELTRRNSITRKQRRSLLHMLSHHKTHVVGNRFHSPLGNRLPQEKSKWMEDRIMRKTGFRTGHHHKDGLVGIQGLIDHMGAMQEGCLFHRALLLYYWALGEAGAMAWNKPCIKYHHSDAEVHQRIMMNQARNAPSDDQGYIGTHFECLVTGERYNVKVDWIFGRQLCFVHNYLRSNGERNWWKIAELLETTSMEMGELRKRDYGRMTQWTIGIVNNLTSPENNGDYTAMSSMIKALAETYRKLPDTCVSLTEARVRELKIPSHLTKDDVEEKLQVVSLDLVLDHSPSWNILATTYPYETHEKTPRDLPPGVPSGRGRP